MNYMGDKILIQFKKFYIENNMSNLTFLDVVEMVRSRIKFLKQIEELDPEDIENE